MGKFLKVIVVIALLCAVGVWVTYSAFFCSAVSEDRILYIRSHELQSAGYESVMQSEVLPYLAHHQAFDVYASYLNLPERIKSGRYELKQGMSVVDVVRMLKLGTQRPISLIFNNIRTPEQLAGRLAQEIEADSVTILATLSSPELLKEFGFKNKEAMMSIFIPNTYEMYWNIAPEKLVRRMMNEYNKFWTPEREAKRKTLSLSKLDISTLASIVYEETAKEDEMPRVAGVYINRLKRGMRLQADPTVKYALGDFEIKRVLYKHLECDSPYNTYIYAGVPPTPIAMPSIAAIDGVLNYEKHNYIFFCARPTFDGYHNFARTLSEHNANSRAYSAALNRLNIK